MYCANCKKEWATIKKESYTSTQYETAIKISKLNRELLETLGNIGMPIKRDEYGEFPTEKILTYIDMLSACCDKPNIFYVKLKESANG